MDSSGSFWTYSYKSPNTSPIYEALDAANCDLDKLLEYEDFLQELKANEIQLVEYLCEPESLRRLVSLITVEPPAWAHDRRLYRQPFLANEAICLENENLIKAFFLEEPEYVRVTEAFWRFLDNPAPLNPVLAGYFNRSATAMFHRAPEKFSAYLSKNKYLFDKMLNHLSSRSIAELLKSIICYGLSEPSKAVFPLEHLTTRILQRLKFTEGGPEDIFHRDVTDNVALLWQSMIGAKKDVQEGDVIVNEFVSEDNMLLLLDCLCSNRLWAITAAVDILCTFINFACTDQYLRAWLEDGLDKVERVLDISLPSGDEDEALDQIEDLSLHERYLAVYNKKQDIDTVELYSGSAEMQYVVQARFLDDFFFPRLLDLKANLLPSLSSDLPTVAPAFGLRAMQFLKLLEAILLSNSTSAADKIVEVGLMKDLTLLFFMHRWNNTLHLQFSTIFRVSLYRGLQNEELLEALLTKTPFLVNAVKYLRVQARLRDCKDVSIRRKKALLLGGLLPHIVHICDTIDDCSNFSPWLYGFLSEFLAWVQIVKPELDYLDKQLMRPTYDATASTETKEGNSRFLLQERGDAKITLDVNNELQRQLALLEDLELDGPEASAKDVV